MNLLLPFAGALLVFFTIQKVPKMKGVRGEELRERLSQVKVIGQTSANYVDEMNLPFGERFFKPAVDYLIKNIAAVLPMDKKSQQKLAEQLAQAGIRMSARDYAAMNFLLIVLLTLAGGYLGFLIGQSAAKASLFALLGLFGGYTLRRFSFAGKTAKRKLSLQNQLPEVLDLLSVSVSAGLGFDQALAYVVKKSRGSLIDEFQIAQQEIFLGRPRKDALKQFAARCALEEVKMFVSAVNQADELGISMQKVLTTQAAMIRLAHKQQIEEKAMKIPVKILLPIVAFIFPVIFIILLGPAVPSILQALGGL